MRYVSKAQGHSFENFSGMTKGGRAITINYVISNPFVGINKDGEEVRGKRRRISSAHVESKKLILDDGTVTNKLLTLSSGSVEGKVLVL